MTDEVRYLKVTDGLSQELHLALPQVEDPDTDTETYDDLIVRNELEAPVSIFVGRGDGAGGTTWPEEELLPGDGKKFGQVNAGNYVTLLVGQLDDGQVEVKNSVELTLDDDEATATENIVLTIVSATSNG